MDPDRFEIVLQGLSVSPSRRRALNLLAGSALAGLFGLNAVATVAKKGGGKDKKKKKKKRNDSTCVFDADCNGNPNGPVCCHEEGAPQCEQCCLTDNRGCPSTLLCSVGTPEDPNVCIYFPF